MDPIVMQVPRVITGEEAFRRRKTGQGLRQVYGEQPWGGRFGGSVWVMGRENGEMCNKLLQATAVGGWNGIEVLYNTGTVFEVLMVGCGYRTW